MREGSMSEFGESNPAYTNEIDEIKEMDLPEEFKSAWIEVLDTAPPEIVAELKEHFDPKSLAEAENAEQIIDITEYLQERIDEAKSKYPEFKSNTESPTQLPKWVLAAVSLVAMLNVAFASPNIAMAAPTSQHENSTDTKRIKELEENKHHTITEAIELYVRKNHQNGTLNWGEPVMGYKQRLLIPKQKEIWATDQIIYINKEGEQAISTTTTFILKHSKGNWNVVEKIQDDVLVLSKEKIDGLGIPDKKKVKVLKYLGIKESPNQH